MQVAIVESKGGKTSVYLGRGSLHYTLFRTGYCVSDIHKIHWYYEGNWSWDGKTGILTLAPSNGNIGELRGLVKLVNKRSAVSQVYYSPVKIVYRQVNSMPIEISVF